MIWLQTLLVLPLFLFSCGGSSSSKKANPQQQTVSDVTVDTTLEITEGPMAGTSAVFPAGSLAIGDAVEISVVTEQPSELAAVFAAGSAQASPAGVGFIVKDSAGEIKDLTVPGTLTIALNADLALTAEASRENVGVLCKTSAAALLAYLAKGAKPKEGSNASVIPVLKSGTYTAAFIGNEAPEGFSIYDREAPTLTSSKITVASVVSTSLTLSWTKSSDDASTQANLSYTVYRSTTNNISTASDAVANGTVLNEAGTKDIATLAVTGLKASTDYYFNVLVTDEAGTSTAYESVKQATTAELPKGPYRMFLTSVLTNGQIGGVSGADALCQSDNNNPDKAKTWKVFLVQDGIREACTVANCGSGSQSNDWVLQPNVAYRTADGATVIGTTTAAAIFTFDLENAIDSSDDTPYWTGFGAINWVVGADTCSSWNTASSGMSGSTGQSGPDEVSSSMIFLNAATCDSTRKLLCVEQP